MVSLCPEKLAREALLAFLSGPGMLVGRGPVKMNSLISAAEIDKQKEHSRGVSTMDMGIETRPLAIINHGVPGMKKTRQCQRYHPVMTITEDFWSGKEARLKLPKQSQNLPLKFPDFQWRGSQIFFKPYFAYCETSLQPSLKGIYVQLFGNGKEKKILRLGEGVLQDTAFKPSPMSGDNREVCGLPIQGDI